MGFNFSWDYIERRYEDALLDAYLEDDDDDIEDDAIEDDDEDYDDEEDYDDD